MFYFNHEGINELVKELLARTNYPCVNSGLAFEHVGYCYDKMIENVMSTACFSNDFVKDLFSHLAKRTFDEYGYTLFLKFESDNVFQTTYYVVFKLLDVLVSHFSRSPVTEQDVFNVEEAIFYRLNELSFKAYIMCA